MKVISYNVNGLRAAINKGFVEWLKSENPDVICIQETKCTKEDIDPTLFEGIGYKSYFYSAQKKGYSGVAIFSKNTPLSVEYGCGNELYDFEGRVITVHFSNCSVMSVYHPSGTTGDVRQDFKMKWLTFFEKYCAQKTHNSNYIIAGDFNICHTEIDIHNPKSNAKTSGFLPEERAWVSKYISQGYIDTFRELNKEPHQYSWWSYRAGSREKNLGWRIDYIFTTENLRNKIKQVSILSSVIHSDHCPIVATVEV
jgi:exodeoxyribonuclease III